MTLIFSDVDGTLLSDDGRCSLPAARLREAVRRHTVVLASSRDTGELHDLQQELGWEGACIAEDGAVLVGGGGPELLGRPRPEVVAALRSALPSTEAESLLASEPPAARDRLASILLPVDRLTGSVQEQLVGAGLEATPGGRWATITRGAGKGAAAGVLAGRQGVTDWAAIGNAPNDASLLAAARWPFVIRNPGGHDPALRQLRGAILLEAPGQAGWLEMLEFLERPVGDPS